VVLLPITRILTGCTSLLLGLSLLSSASSAAEAPPGPEPTPIVKTGGLVPHEGSGPFWEWGETPDNRLYYRIMYPFIEGSRKPGKRVFTFRPFFSHEDEGPGSRRWKFRLLWPLIIIERTEDTHRVRIFPFVWERNRSKVDGKVHDKDFWILPIFWRGSDTEKGRYLAIWPLGGMIKGVFGKRYIRFFLWPLWVETKDKNYHAWNFPWPILGYWKGPDQRGWRVWPLFGVNQRDNKFKRVFFLWPLGHYWRTGLDTRTPGYALALLPLFAKMQNKYYNYTSILWPFFARNHNKKIGFVEWHFPWPFFSRTTGKGIRGLKIWPLFHYRFAPTIQSWSFGWKVFHRKVTRNEYRKTTKTSFCLIFQKITNQWIEEPATKDRPAQSRSPEPDARSKLLAAERSGDKKTVSERKKRPENPGQVRSSVNTLLWPLLRYKRDGDGRKFFTILEPWFFRPREIWERHYAPFFTLYRYESKPGEFKRERALFNLYEHYRSPIERRVRFSPIVDYWRRGKTAEYKRFRILGGLFGYERQGKAKRVRFLWIPIGRRPKGWK
jgi:hypothetical protein